MTAAVSTRQVTSSIRQVALHELDITAQLEGNHNGGSTVIGESAAFKRNKPLSATRHVKTTGIATKVKMTSIAMMVMLTVVMWNKSLVLLVAKLRATGCLFNGTWRR
jgi:hypothetical protein